MPNLLPARAVLAMALCLAGTACVQVPTVTLHHADIRGVSLTGPVIDVVIAINNPNSYDIKMRDVTAETTFANRYTLPPIVLHPDMWLPSGQVTQVHVPTTLPWLMIPGILAETVMSPQVVYHVRGSANVTATRTFGIEEDNVPIELTGTMPRNILVNVSTGQVTF